MPRPVVPILAAPRLISRALSMATWYGRISVAASEMRRRLLTSTPADSSSSISLNSASGDSTTPLPM